MIWSGSWIIMLVHAYCLALPYSYLCIRRLWYSFASLPKTPSVRIAVLIQEAEVISYPTIWYSHRDTSKSFQSVALLLRRLLVGQRPSIFLTLNSVKCRIYYRAGTFSSPHPKHYLITLAHSYHRSSIHMFWKLFTRYCTDSEVADGCLSIASTSEARPWCSLGSLKPRCLR